MYKGILEDSVLLQNTTLSVEAGGDYPLIRTLRLHEPLNQFNDSQPSERDPAHFYRMANTFLRPPRRLRLDLRFRLPLGDAIAARCYVKLLTCCVCGRHDDQATTDHGNLNDTANPAVRFCGLLDTTTWTRRCVR